MDWQSVVIPIAVTAATALISWALSLLTAVIKNKVKNETAAQYLNEALDIVDDAVKSTYQTYVQSLKEQGTFDKDAQIAALQKAKCTILSHLSGEAQDYVKQLFGDLNGWIETQIESKLYELKQPNSAT